MEKRDIKSLTLPALEGELAGLGLPRFRAGQVYGWLHQKRVSTFAEMTNLPAALRGQLDEKYYINAIQVKKSLYPSWTVR